MIKRKRNQKLLSPSTIIVTAIVVKRAKVMFSRASVCPTERRGEWPGQRGGGWSGQKGGWQMSRGRWMPHNTHPPPEGRPRGRPPPPPPPRQTWRRTTYTPRGGPRGRPPTPPPTPEADLEADHLPPLTTTPPPGNTVNARAVRTLLECILVSK